MKKKNVVKKDVREKRTLHRSPVKHVKPAVTKKVEMVEPVVEKEQPKKQKKNKPVQVVEQNIDTENNE